MFLHPRQARAALEGTPGLAAFRFVVDRVDHRDLLRCEIEGETGADQADLAARVRARVRAALRFDAQVTPVALVGEGDLIEDTRDWS
jgi:phenylacetate-CoA ligase